MRNLKKNMELVTINISPDHVGKNNIYFQGSGIDLSKEKKLAPENAKHINLPRDQFFSLRDHCKPESQDFIYISDILETKFYPLILKEMLISCKREGFLIVEAKNSAVISFPEFVKEAKLLMQDKAGLRKEDHHEKVLVFQKTKSLLEQGDSISKFTFGIISNGKRNEQIDQQIEAIKQFKIPEYEIIVCGLYKETKDKKINYIFFDAYDKGWITAQKNLILENAKYENVVVMHDRILPQKDFYQGLKKYGNYFEILSCKITNQQGERCGDWITHGNPLDKPPRIGLLEYKDWDKDIWLDGAFYIMKKSVWRQVQWNEALFWNQAEDMKLAQGWKEKGFIPRYNPFSSCLTLSWRHGQFPKYQFDEKKLGKRDVAFIPSTKEKAKFYIKKALGKK